MSDILLFSFADSAVGMTTAWLITLLLLFSGLVGCFIPSLPGHLLIFIAAIAHRLMLGAEGSGLHWWSFLILFLLMALSQAFEYFSGAAGSKWFGGTRWGALGAFVGTLVGVLFFPFGLLLGPLVGSIACELIFARQTPRAAGISGAGSVAGTLAGLGMKVAVGLVMGLWLILDILLIG